MNLPNKLTLLRVLMIPFFVVALLMENGNNQTYSIIAFIIFVLASITDALDGYIARKYKLITNFGKLMDPLADKLLVCSALICFIELGRLKAWVVIIIIAREFAISAFRLIATENGVVIAAGILGKLKTVCQMITVMLLILNIEVLKPLTDVLIIIMILLTIVSLIDYIVKNHSIITSGKM